MSEELFGKLPAAITEYRRRANQIARRWKTGEVSAFRSGMFMAGETCVGQAAKWEQSDGTEPCDGIWDLGDVAVLVYVKTPMTPATIRQSERLHHKNFIQAEATIAKASHGKRMFMNRKYGGSPIDLVGRFVIACRLSAAMSLVALLTLARPSIAVPTLL